jgi:hypothetical protein
MYLLMSWVSCLPHCKHTQLEYTSVTKEELTLAHHKHLKFIVGFISMHFCKCVMVCIYHYSYQSIFITLEVFHAQSIHPFSRFPTTANHWSIYCLCHLLFSRYHIVPACGFFNKMYEKYTVSFTGLPHSVVCI